MRHPQYLDIPLHLHWEAARRRRWLIVALVFLALFLVGVSMNGGT